MNTWKIFPWPLHPYPRQSNTRTVKTSSSEEQLRIACAFSSAALMRSFGHRSKRLFQEEPLRNPLELNSEQSALAPSGTAVSAPGSHARAEPAGAGGTFPGGGWKPCAERGRNGKLPPRAATPWRWVESKEKREPSSAAATPSCIRLVGEGNQRGSDDAVREEGEGSPGSPGQPPPPPKPAWSAAKPHRNATRSHDLRRTCNSLPSPGTPCAILYWRSYKGRHDLLPSRSLPASLSTAPALFGKEKPRPDPAFLFASSSETPCPRSPPWCWDHGARFLPLPPPAAPDPAQLRLPLLQDDVSASQSGRAGPPGPGRPLAAAPLPPPSWLGLRRGSLRSRS